MKQLFNQIQIKKPKSNFFDLSHEVKLSCNMGDLVPIMAIDTIPGDKFKITPEILARVAPLVAPLMHRVDVTIHYFYVPNRLLWPNWEDFITSAANITTPPAPPTMEVSTPSYTDLLDFMGIPNPIGLNQEIINALPFAAYQRIYNDYYRSQQLQAEVVSELTDGDNSGNSDLYTLRKRCWEHDYFTSALPNAQAGAGVTMPIGSIELDPDWATLPTNPRFVEDDLSDAAAGNIVENAGPGANIYSSGDILEKVAYDPANSLYVSSSDVIDFRRALKLQQWLEKAARGGKRYFEMIKSFFGITPSDARLQRPEYITGVKTPIQISEVLNTTGTVDAPQGNMAGHGVSYTQGQSGGYFCEDHGWIIGIMSIMPRTAYQQGIARKFLKTDPLDYYWEDFAHIGEQEIERRELYAFQGAAGDNTFGYIPRYTEYKNEDNRVAGEFRTTLDYWHMGRKFSAPPLLNAAFVQSDPTHRVFANIDPAEEKIYCQVYNQIHAIRQMPKFGTPGL